MHWIDEIEALRPVVSPELLRVAMPNCPDLDEWAEELSEALAWGEIRDPAEVAMFLAQAGHESADLTRLEESLYYTTERLRAVWPRRFPDSASTKGYARNPDALANYTYGGRLGNTMPGDGWKFRGRGAIQLTGRYNYAECAKATGLPLLAHPGRLATMPRYGAMSAVWYWMTRVTPGASIEKVTKEVNGGRHGLEDRRQRHQRILRYISQQTGRQEVRHVETTETAHDSRSKR